MKDKANFYIFISIIAVLVLVIILSSLNVKEYSTNLFYMDTYINVKIYTNNKNKAERIFKGVEDLYNTYDKLTNKYVESEYGLYSLNHGSDTIDYRLYKIIESGYFWNKKSNGLLNIAIGNVTDIWKKYREEGTGIPTKEELKKVSIKMSDVLINGTKSDIPDKKIKDSVILSNGVTIDLGALAKGYTTELVGEYLKNNGINEFIINAGGNVLVGNHHGLGKYKIGIQNPEGEGIFKTIKAENMAVVTSGSYQRNYTYEGKVYHHIIDPNTLFPADNMLSVTVISKSSADADALSTILFLMDVDKGMEYIKDYDAEAIWYLNDGSIKTTPGISSYE